MGKHGNPQKTILVLNDEDTERATIRQVLERQDCTVVEAESCKNALAVYEEHRTKINLLIADISLPDGNGCELAIVLRERKPDLRVLFVSGHVGAEVCRFYGLDVTDLHFLRKPFKPAELLNAVERVFSSTTSFPELVPKTRTA
jgi:DNA-binding response OmpR family regulator